MSLGVFLLCEDRDLGSHCVSHQVRATNWEQWHGEGGNGRRGWCHRLMLCQDRPRGSLLWDPTKIRVLVLENQCLCAPSPCACAFQRPHAQIVRQKV